MKRSRDWVDDPKSKNMKTTSLTLHDDAIYEVCKWLPSRFVIEYCSLVDKQWNKVIESRVNLDLDLSLTEWWDFCVKKRGVASSITNLTINGRFDPWITLNEIEGKVFDELTSLKSLSFRNLSIKHDFVRYIVDHVTFKRISFEGCVISPIDMMPLTSLDESISVSLSGIIIREQNAGFVAIEVREKLIHTISLIRGLESLDCSEWRYPSNDKYVAFLEHLANAKHLSKITLRLDEYSTKYIPRMKNLTSLTTIESDARECELPDLSALTQLKHVAVKLPIRVRKEESALGFAASGGLLGIDSLRHFGSSGEDKLPQSNRIGSTPMIYGREEECKPRFLASLIGRLNSLAIPDARTLCREEKLFVQSLDNLLELDLRLWDPRNGYSHESRSIMAALNQKSPIDSFPRNLTRLNLINSSIKPSGVLSLASIKTLTDLTIRDVYVEEINHQAKRKTPSIVRRLFDFSDLCQEKDGNPYCDLQSLCRLSVEPPPRDSDAFAVLSSMSCLGALCLNHGEEPNICSHIDQVAECKSLRELEVRVDRMTIKEAQQISSMPCLKRLALHTDHIKIPQARQIASMKYLKEIHITCTSFDDGVFEMFCRMDSLSTLVFDSALLDGGDHSDLLSQSKLKIIRGSYFETVYKIPPREQDEPLGSVKQ